MSDPEQQKKSDANRGLTPAEQLEAAEVIHRERALRARQAQEAALDDESASHEGGLGAQGGATDYGHPR